DAERQEARRCYDDGAREERQTPAEAATERSRERRNGGDEQLKGEECETRQRGRQLRSADHHERDQGEHDRERAIEERGEEVGADNRPRGEDRGRQHGPFAQTPLSEEKGCEAAQTRK